MMQADMLWNRIGTYLDEVLEHNWNEVSDLDACLQWWYEKKESHLNKSEYVDSFTDALLKDVSR